MMNKFYLINSLKGFLCIWIVLFHYTCKYYEVFDVHNDLIFSWTNGAGVAVPLFFMISGFLTQYSFIQKGKQISVQWLWGKLKRLYPTFLISLFVIFIILKITCVEILVPSVKNLVLNAALLPVLGTKYLDGAHWYLFALLKFYIIYYAIAKIRAERKSVIYLALLAICLLAHYSDIKVLKMLTLTDGLLFLFTGCAVANAYMYRAKTHLYVAACYLISMICLLQSVTSVIYILVFIFIITPPHDTNPIYEDHVIVRILDYIGAKSFAWYLIHQYVGFVLIYRLSMNCGVKMELSIIISMIITFVLSVCVTETVGYLNHFFTIITIWKRKKY